MGCGCCNEEVDNEAREAFAKGGKNDLSEGIVTDRRCTDVFCIPFFAVFQIIFIAVTLAGFADGDPTLLYKPRDYRGSYCGVKENWNSGPNTENMPFQSFSMNLSGIVEPAMKQTICSSVAREVLADGSGNQPPLLTTTEEQLEYLCNCCLIPCKPCQGSLQVGGDLTTPEELSNVIRGRMMELTDPAQAQNLFDPSGNNGDRFSGSAFWSKVTEYMQMVCLPSCDTGYANTPTTRDHFYSPDQDTKWYKVWQTVASAAGIVDGGTNVSNSTGMAALGQVLRDAFIFKALPWNVCPYDTSSCVMMPGVEFDMIGQGTSRCTFKIAKEVVDVLGQGMADSMSGIGVDAVSSAASESFGQMVGAVQASLDTFVLTSVLAFVFALVFLVVLRFFIGWVVWISLAFVVFLFAFGGGVLFVLSGQCKDAGLFESGRQQAVAVVVAGQHVAKSAVSGIVFDESMTGDGADYRGAQSRSINGRQCSKWDQQVRFPKYNSSNFPDAGLVERFCRNPYFEGTDFKAKTIWCVTEDAERQWEECLPVGIIRPPCQHGYAIDGETSRQILFGSSFALWAMGAIVIIVILVFVQRIRLAIALNKVAARYLGNNPQTVLIPVAQSIVTLLWCLGWLMGASFLLSQVPVDHSPSGYFETFEEAAGTGSTCTWFESSDDCAAGVPGECTNKWPTGGVWKDKDCETDAEGVVKCWRCWQPRYVFDARFAMSFFVFLWNNAFMVALGQILIAMCVGLWFFQTSENQQKRSVVFGAVRTITRYHLGSVMFGSFIVAVVEFLRYVAKYYEKQAKAMKNQTAALILKCVQCVLWCFEKFIQFLNKNAYIQIALTGKDFIPAAKAAWFLILRNLLRFGTVAALGRVVSAVGVTFIVCSTVFSGYMSLRAMHPDVYPFVPIVIYIIIGYVVARLFMTVFTLAVDTSLHCFMIVEEMGTSVENVPPELRHLVHHSQRLSKSPLAKGMSFAHTASARE